jgi:hypothetical protein
MVNLLGNIAVIVHNRACEFQQPDNFFSSIVAGYADAPGNIDVRYHGQRHVSRIKSFLLVLPTAADECNGARCGVTESERAVAIGDGP